MRIFLGTYPNPCKYRWFDLSDPADIEAIEKIQEEEDEILVSDNENDLCIELIGENDIVYYLEMQEMLENLEDYDYPKAYGICDYDSHYAKDSEALKRRIEDSYLYEGDLSDVAEQLFDDYYSHDCPDVVKNYVDFEKWGRQLDYDGCFHSFDYEGKSYVIEIL